MAKPASVIGAAVGRVEGADKVSGQATYGADVHFPDTLWGKILRSPYPHARIVRIDTTKAWQVPGVKAIVTGDVLTQTILVQEGGVVNGRVLMRPPEGMAQLESRSVNELASTER